MIGERSKPQRNTTAFLRLGIAVVLFAASLLAVFRAPSYNLWKVSVLVTEWGHYLALVSLLLFLMSLRRTRIDRIASAFTLLATAAFLSPLLRARPVASAIGTALADMEPRSAAGAPSLSSPLRLAGLFNRPVAPGVGMTTLSYDSGSGENLKIDLYRRNDNSQALPLVVVIHGGSWMGGSRSDLAALNNYLAARGYAVAAVSYRFAPEFRHPAQSTDVAAAIDYMKSVSGRRGIDSTRIVVIGRSAGGQLALMAAYTKNDPSIRGVVAFYAPTDQKWGWDHPADPRVYDSHTTLRSFLGGSPAENREAYLTSSPISYVGYATVPTLLIHGSRDELVSVRQSARLDSALSVSRRPHLFLEFPWATHGCDYVFNGPCGQISTYAIERFIASVM